MSGRGRQEEERLLELLADRCVSGLSESESAELDSLVESLEADAESFDRAAAVLHQLYGLDDVALPPDLYANLQRQGEAFCYRPSDSGQAHRPRRRWLEWSGWVAAAGIISAMLLPRTVPSPLAPGQTAAESRNRFLHDRRDVQSADWKATQDASSQGAGGDVVWSGSAQGGYMRFRGLPKNDPARFQYQLWIFDRERDQRYPIDGGVFDVYSGSEVVPIDAKLRVETPTLFAVTIERPGGVVVSKRERIVLTAEPTP